jgi:hypothetical protein
MKKITVEVSDTVYQLLEVLSQGRAKPKVEDVVLQLIDHAQQGVYRPGAWEREWLMQAFGPDWIEHLEGGDPYGREGCEDIFNRPATKRRSPQKGRHL